MTQSPPGCACGNASSFSLTSMSATDLPAELILEIASYLGFEDATQIHLALTCRQFYEVVIPQILADEAKHVREVMIPDKRINLFRGTNIIEHSLESAQLDSKDEPFMGTYRKVGFSAGADSKDLRCFRRILLRAPLLESVTLHIPDPCMLHRLFTYINACAGRPGLELTISLGYLYSLSARSDVGGSRSGVSLPGKMKTIFSPALATAKRLFKGWSSSISPKPVAETPGTSRTQLPIISRPRISSLSIENDTLFRSVIYPSVNDLMNTAPITSLSISHMTINTMTLFDYEWAQILSSLTMPVLTHLAFRQLHIAFEDLIAFLERHCMITNLTLNLSSAKALADTPFPSTPLLPHLTSLTGNVQCLTPFLIQQKRGHVPELSHLILRKSLQFKYLGDRQARVFHPLYDLIVQGHYKSLAIGGLRDSGLVEWIISSPLSEAGWPTPRQFLGVDELIIEGDFTIAEETRVAMLEWIDDHRPSLAKENMSANQEKEDGPVKKKQRLLERFIWYTCPQLQVLQLGIIDSDNSPIVRMTRVISDNLRH